jgi:thiol-disulfide isomerase/thioredoxin
VKQTTFIRHVGRDLPKFAADGWLNGDAPTAERLKGKVIVVNAWFTTCPAGLAEALALVKSHAEYRDRDVVFIALTFEGAEQLPDIQKFLRGTGISWPNGYGALGTLTELEVEYFPAVWVIGRDGKIVWNFDSPGELADGIELALSQK